MAFRKASSSVRSSDPACAENNKTPVTTEAVLVDNGGLQNVFVYIKDGLGNKYLFDTPTDPVVLDQRGCHYLPHVVGLRATQPLQVVNSDNTLHNVNGMPENNRGAVPGPKAKPRWPGKSADATKARIATMTSTRPP